VSVLVARAVLQEAQHAQHGIDVRDPVWCILLLLDCQGILRCVSWSVSLGHECMDVSCTEGADATSRDAEWISCT
jgi:hypothetical protein